MILTGVLVPARFRESVCYWGGNTRGRINVFPIADNGISGSMDLGV